MPPNVPTRALFLRRMWRATVTSGGVVKQRLARAARDSRLDALEVWDGARLAFREPRYSTRCQEWATRDLLRASLRQPQDDIAIAILRTAHLAETIHELAVEPDPNQALLPQR
jgi:hypothetical protein